MFRVQVRRQLGQTAAVLHTRLAALKALQEWTPVVDLPEWQVFGEEDQN